jgi:hypothetical protein
MLRTRRLIALALLLGYGASAAEAAVGVVRDGAVHHESAAAAAVHQESHHGDHGHEDPGTDAEHGSEHQHGTSGDHCTHAHGTSLPAVCDLDVATQVEATARPTAPPLGSGTAATSHFRPPKA